MCSCLGRSRSFGMKTDSLYVDSTSKSPASVQKSLNAAEKWRGKKKIRRAVCQTGSVLRMSVTDAIWLDKSRIKNQTLKKKNAWRGKIMTSMFSASHIQSCDAESQSPVERLSLNSIQEQKENELLNTNLSRSRRESVFVPTSAPFIDPQAESLLFLSFTDTQTATCIKESCGCGSWHQRNYYLQGFFSFCDARFADIEEVQDETTA